MRLAIEFDKANRELQQRATERKRVDRARFRF